MEKLGVTMPPRVAMSLRPGGRSSTPLLIVDCFLFFSFNDDRRREEPFFDSKRFAFNARYRRLLVVL